MLTSIALNVRMSPGDDPPIVQPSFHVDPATIPPPGLGLIPLASLKGGPCRFMFILTAVAFVALHGWLVAPEPGSIEVPPVKESERLSGDPPGEGVKLGGMSRIPGENPSSRRDGSAPRTGMGHASEPLPPLGLFVSQLSQDA